MMKLQDKLFSDIVSLSEIKSIFCRHPVDIDFIREICPNFYNIPLFLPCRMLPNTASQQTDSSFLERTNISVFWNTKLCSFIRYSCNVKILLWSCCFVQTLGGNGIQCLIKVFFIENQSKLKKISKSPIVFQNEKPSVGKRLPFKYY